LGFQLIISDSIASVCCTRSNTLCKSKEKKTPKSRKERKKEKMPTLLRLLHKLDKEGIDIIYLEKVGKQL
jgi:hypothetical protein